ncbi:MAG: hypothetical protein ACYS9X_00760 [Planctomycetota bacterium]|jgi:hypothetical protein
MRANRALVVLALAVAAVAHFVAARMVRGTPLLGAGGFAREMATIVGEPATGGDAGGLPLRGELPLRISLGDAERAPARARGPRAALDPGSVRRPPQAGADWPGLPGHAERLAECAVALSAEPGEERDAARVLPPGLAAPFAARAKTPSTMDLAAARDAVDLEVRAATRPLPGRFRSGAAPSLARAAEAKRPSLGADDTRVDLRIDVAPLELPGDWPAPDQAIAAPEVLIDVTAISAAAADE